MRNRYKKKLWVMGGIGVLTAALYSTQYLLFLRKVWIVFAWLYLFSAIALALAPIYLRIGKDHTVNIPASIERRHRYMLIAMPVLAFVSTTVMGIIDGGSFYDILFWVISALLCCASFVLDLTGRRYPALIITGTNILISFLCDYSTCTALLYLLLLLFLPCTSLLFLLLRNKCRFLHWVGLAISGVYFLSFMGLDIIACSLCGFFLMEVKFHYLLYALGFWLEGDRAELRPAHTAPSAYPALEAYKKRISNTKQKG